MFNVGDYVVYKRDVCRIKEIKKSHFNNQDYYVLIPIDDETLKIDVPTDNRCGFLRAITSKDKVTNIIESMINIPIIETNNKMIEENMKI